MKSNLIFSEKYQKQIRENSQFRQDVLTKVFGAVIICNYICSEDLVLGEIPKRKLPDVYIVNFHIGFELTVADLDVDLDITKAIAQVESKTESSNLNVSLSNYNYALAEDGKVAWITPRISARRIDYPKTYYKSIF